MPPQFSIVIATHNARETLADCLASIWAQEDAEFEVLVADGASTDGTVEILNATKDRLAAFVSSPDLGVYDAWNRVLDRIRGEWVLFLGADDTFAGPRVLADASRLLKTAADGATMFAFGRVSLKSGDLTIEQFGTEDFPPGRWRVRRRRSFSHTGLFHRRELFDRFGLFDASFRISGDSEFLTRTLQHPDVGVIRLDLDVAIMGLGGLSSSVESRLAAYLEDMRGLRRHGHFIPPLPIVALASRAFAAVLLHRLFGRSAALWASNLYRTLTGRPRRNEM
ncbi:glycosyltransferase [bacterium AH-315-P15]|nr:glycosyltransferase [bacterium AH-315-P15]